MLDLLLFSLFPLAVAYAGFSDFFSMRISNWVSIVLLAAFFLLAPFVLDIKVIGWHVVTFAVVLAIAFGLFAAGLLGGGDAKLLAVIALWLGLEFMVPYMFYLAIFGGLLALAFIVFRKFTLPEGLRSIPWLARLHSKTEGIPYGVALGAAALVIYPKTPWMASMLG